MTGTYVIVGAGLAGAKAAEALRAEGFDGPVVLLGDEAERPYERPPLSKGYLLGKAGRDTIYVHPESWYAEHDVELRLGSRAEAVDPATHTVSLADGTAVGYAKLLLATGSATRPLPVPGADRALYLRSAADSDAIKAAFTTDARVVIIGGGWIGLEAAAAARAAGADVTVLEAADLPLLRVLGPEAARVFAGLHVEHGVDLRCRAQVSHVAAGGVALADGTVIGADVVIAGVGIAPRTALAEAAGLEVNDGIRVDASLRTADPDIYAAGDVASAFHPAIGAHLRVEHWANALHQPQAAARSMLGAPVSYDRVPYFFTDQYDLGMEYSGYVAPGTDAKVVFRGEVRNREFIAFWLGSEDQVLAGMNVNVWDATDAIQALVRSGKPVDRAALRDPAVPLESLA